MDFIQTYSSVITAMGALSLLMLSQVLVADVLGLRAKHLPGSQVPADHSNPLFRATRTVANTNESITVFVLAILFCIFSGASVSLTTYAAWTFVAARLLYAICYYSNLQRLRSTMFGVSLLALIGLIVIGFFG